MKRASHLPSEYLPPAATLFLGACAWAWIHPSSFHILQCLAASVPVSAGYAQTARASASGRLAKGESRCTQPPTVCLLLLGVRKMVELCKWAAGQQVGCCTQLAICTPFVLVLGIHTPPRPPQPGGWLGGSQHCQHACLFAPWRLAHATGQSAKAVAVHFQGACVCWVCAQTPQASSMGQLIKVGIAAARVPRSAGSHHGGRQ